MDEIARAAGASKPVLYSELGDERGVADAVAVTSAHRLEARAASDLAGQELDLPRWCGPRPAG